MEQVLSLSEWLIHWGAIITFALLFLGIVFFCILYVIDVRQTQHTIRRNYPVIGRMRYILEHLGEFFRQYFFAFDRDELPFNRAERSWVYRAAKHEDTTQAFGSTRPLDQKGEVFFVSSTYPKLTEELVEPSAICFGEFTAREPYRTNSIINISGMSFGALSKPAIKALSKGAAKAGAWMNTGEGGLSPYHLEGNCDIVFQIGTAKYGVQDDHGHLDTERLKNIAQHKQVKMIEIKLSQGAKPGKGGMLPGSKVTAEIAEVRNIKVGEDSISPNRHVDIANTHDLLEMIHKVRKLTGKPTGIKLVVGELDFFDELFKQIHQRGFEYAPDFITLDSADGGTGAAPQTLMDYVGMTVRESLPAVVNRVTSYGLRSRIKIIATGKLVVPGKVAWAFAMGADAVVSARGFLFSIGCIQALKCNQNTCPTGITTHDEKLQKGLVPEEKAERVANYISEMKHSVGLVVQACGVDEPRQLTRKHVRLIEDQNHSVRYDDVDPLPTEGASLENHPS
ncbi:FMN-binding glutamate synthase family protein [Marinomonas ostreistagni]|uniref:FMN-binding glutamate synthase family protein n=1 Tax=Marinomonas ostreistagni TaxID=359209 RepID=A0ABS0ZEP6_9GAMM|nr:FMN-binding glutamate synthase family protein [Marinomonas ostreistagni]MBJ7551868.1 FMN-binding glutamate synthase family protein [Marinomonas ostreistagni]